VFGKPMRISAERGRVLEAGDRIAVVTTHPSAVVRQRGEPDFPQAFDALVHDLVVAAGAASSAEPVSKE
jgi:DNA polymerase